jgi:membrane protease YdiL (CAAX protease family)
VAPLEKYVTAKPKDFDGFYYLGITRLELRQFDLAACALQRAHELKPDDKLTRLGLLLSFVLTAQYAKVSRLYPLIYTVGGGLLGVCYVIGLAWMLVKSFQPGAKAWPGVWFVSGWVALFFAGQVVCAFLLGCLPPFHGVAATLVGLGTASLPLIVAAGAGFTCQPWGAPFAWPKPLPPARLLVLSVLGVIAVELFEAAYSGLNEWITHKPFPVQVAVPMIREALRTNPISVAVSIVLLAPLAEEVLFRGLLFGALQKWLTARGTIILTAAIFALVHMQAAYFVPIFLLGLILGWARHKSGSLAVPMLLHVLNNGFSLLLLQLLPQST